MPKESKTKSSAQPTRRTKSKKDPAAPKRPLSAYMFFSQDHREKVKTENPDAGFGTYLVEILTVCATIADFVSYLRFCNRAGDVGRLLGAKWKEMSDAEKKPYLDMANRDKLRAEAEKAAYQAR